MRPQSPPRAPLPERHPPGCRPERRERGFALVELMVALVLLAVGVLALASVLLGTSQRTDRVASQLDFAAAAESKLEDLWSASYTVTNDSLSLSLGGSLTGDEPYHSDVFTTAEGREFQRRWEVTGGPGKTRHVTVRVTATAGRTVSHRDYETLIYRRR